MFIKKISIKNFRCFREFELDNINVPDGETEGLGITVLVGDNGLGKSALLDAIALAMIPGEAHNFGDENYYNHGNEQIEIEVHSKEKFTVNGQMARGIRFAANKQTSWSREHIDANEINQDNVPGNSTDIEENMILFLDKDRASKISSGNYRADRTGITRDDLDRLYLECTVGGDILTDDMKERAFKYAMTDFHNTRDFHGIEEMDDKTMVNYLIDPNTQEILVGSFKGDFLRRNGRLVFENQSPVLKSGKMTGAAFPLSNLGSGYVMFFSFLYFIRLAQESGKQLIVIADEPELHLHPRLQEEFAIALRRFATTAQVIAATHSRFFVKEALSHFEMSADEIEKHLHSPLADDGLLNDTKNTKNVIRDILSYNGDDKIERIAAILKSSVFKFPSLAEKLIKQEHPTKQECSNLVIDIFEPLVFNAKNMAKDFLDEFHFIQRKKVRVLEKESMEMDKFVLSSVSANEIDYVAFGMPTEGYHSELYEKLKSNYRDYLYRNAKHVPNLNKLSEFDKNFFVHVGKNRSMKQVPNKPSWGDKFNDCERGKHLVTLHTYVRNQIHHAGDYKPLNPDELADSIAIMREFFSIEEGANPPDE